MGFPPSQHAHELIEIMPDAVVTIDHDHCIRFINRAGELLFGYTIDEIIGENIRILIPEEYHTMHDKVLRQFARARTRKRRMGKYRTVWGQHKEGYRIPLEATIGKTTFADKPAFTVILHDASTVERVAQELDRQMSLYQAIVEDQTEMIARWKPDGTLLFVNRAIAEYMGTSRELLLGSNLFEHVSNGDRGAIHAQLAALTPTDPVTIMENQVILPAGETRWHQWINRGIFSLAGELVEIQAIGRDISAQKAIITALEASEEQFRNTFEQAAVGMVHCAPDGQFLRVNQKFCELLGYNEAELLQLTFIDITDPEDRDAGQTALAQLLDGHIQQFSLEKKYRRKDGSQMWGNLTVSLVRNPDGDPKYQIAVVQDITARKAMEIQLRTSQAQLATAQTIAQLGSWELNLVTNELRWSAEIYRIFEIDPEKFGAAYEAFLEAVHPEDRELVNQTFLESVRNRTPYEIVHRLLLPDGRIKYVREKGETSYDLQGLPLCSIGTVQDITAHYWLEGQAKKLSQAVEQTGDPVAITDREGRIEYVNAAFENNTGYGASEVLGKTSRILKGGKQPPEIYEQLWQTITRGDIWHGTLINRRKDGTLYYAEKTISPIFGPTGEIIHFVSVEKDLTEQRSRQKEQEAILSVSGVLRWLSDRDEILHAILVETRKLFEAEAATFVSARAHSRQLTLEKLVGSLPVPDTIPDSFHEEIARQQEPRIEQVNTEILQSSAAAYSGWRAGIPVVTQNEFYGVLCIWRVAQINPADLGVVKAIADILASAFHRVKLLELERRRRQESEQLAAIAASLNQALDLEKVLQRITDAACRLIPHVERCVIHRYDEQAKSLLPVAASGPAGLGPAALRLRAGEGIAGLVVQEGRSINISDTQSDTRYLPLGAATHMRSLLVSPVLTGKRLFGTISVQSEATAAFNDNHERLLEALGTNAGIALENARLFEAERRQLSEARLLQRVTAAISSAPDRAAALTEISHSLGAEIAHFNRAGILLELDGQLDWGGGSALRAADSAGEGVALPPAVRTLLARAREQRAPQTLAGQAAKELLSMHEPEASAYDTPILVVPVFQEQESLGYLLVEIPPGFSVQPDDLLLLEKVAQQIGIGLSKFRLMTELSDALDQEKKLRDDLVQAAKLAALGRLTASLAHEINNPLQAIQGCLALVSEEVHNLQEELRSRQYLQIASDEIERISNLLKSMRGYYPVPQGEAPEILDIEKILTSVLAMVGPQLETNAVKFQTTYAQGLEIYAYHGQIKQVLLNLILNAIDSMPKGGVLTIETCARTEAPLRSGKGAAVEISIQDNGHGMPPEVQTHLFEPFFTTKPEGSGLGLSVSHQIVTALGGAILVESAEGVGSTFKLLLPAESPDRASTG